MHTIYIYIYIYISSSHRLSVGKGDQSAGLHASRPEASADFLVVRCSPVTQQQMRIGRVYRSPFTDGLWPSAGGCPATNILLSAGGDLAILFTC